MIDLKLKADKLVMHAQIQGHNHLHDEDLGYAVHGWLRDALGDMAPTTFRLMPQHKDTLRLLGYAAVDADTLREHVQLFASPTAAEVCDWTIAASKDMGDIVWSTGQRLGFEVRVCPVVRGENGERDAFLAQLPVEQDMPSPSSRSGVYRQWLEAKLSPAADLGEKTFELKGFRLISLWRQGRTNGQGGRTGRRLLRPDVLLSGRLTINEPDAFGRLLQRGIGRHRAFGFGMLLLRPA